MLFTHRPDSDKRAEITMTDGSYIKGTVLFFSSDPHETGDRELILGPPMTYHTPKGKTASLQQHTVTIAARQIKMMYVSYVSKRS